MLNDRQGVQGGSSLFCIKICGKGELLITIMSSLVQEESRSISENITWGHRKRFADGKVSVPLSQGPEPSDGQLHPGGSGAGTHQGVRRPAVGQPGGFHHSVQQRRYPGDLQGRDGNQSISRKKGLRQRIQEETQDSLPYF